MATTEIEIVFDDFPEPLDDLMRPALRFKTALVVGMCLLIDQIDCRETTENQLQFVRIKDTT